MGEGRGAVSTISYKKTLYSLPYLPAFSLSRVRPPAEHNGAALDRRLNVCAFIPPCPPPRKETRHWNIYVFSATFEPGDLASCIRAPFLASRPLKTRLARTRRLSAAGPEHASSPHWKLRVLLTCRNSEPPACRRPLLFVLADWSAKTTSTGDIYYENHATKGTTWERPVAPAAPQAAASSHRRGSGSVASVNSSVGSISVGEAPLPPGIYTNVIGVAGAGVGCLLMLLLLSVRKRVL